MVDKLVTTASKSKKVTVSQVNFRVSSHVLEVIDWNARKYGLTRGTYCKLLVTLFIESNFNLSFNKGNSAYSSMPEGHNIANPSDPEPLLWPPVGTHHLTTEDFKRYEKYKEHMETLKEVQGIEIESEFYRGKDEPNSSD